LWVNPRNLPVETAIRVLGKPVEREYSLHELLRRPNVSYESLMTLPGAGAGVGDVKVAEQVETQAKYYGYIERQHEEIGRNEKYETLVLPVDMDYCEVRGLSIEVQQKLNQHLIEMQMKDPLGIQISDTEIIKLHIFLFNFYFS